MKIFNSKFRKFSIPLIVLMAVLFLPKIASAAWGDGFLISISSAIATQIIYVAGQLLLIFINLLIRVASFNDFVDANIVNIGWVLIRDVANMGIVLALLVIAFYTVLNKESYGFSKMITGLVIDVGQIFMMTFVHAFEGIAAGNLTYGFGLQDMLSLRNAAEASGATPVNDWNVFGALVLAVLLVIVALGVVVTMTVMLLYRIVTLWILIILSPIGFVGSIFPGQISALAKEWQSRLAKNVIFGPVLAFRFWLSMTVLSQITDQNRIMNLTAESTQSTLTAGSTASVNNYAFFASQISSPQRILDYLFTCALLIATIITAQKAGVAGSEVAGNFMGKLNQAGGWLKARPGAVGRAVGRGVASSRPVQRVVGLGEGVGKKIKTSKFSHGLGMFGFDKEYKQQKSAEARAKGLRTTGDATALRQLQHQTAMTKQKEMEEKGLLSGGDDALRDLLHKKIKAGKMDEARAVMDRMASSKESNLRTKDLEAYEKAAKIERGSGSKDEQDYMKYTEDLKAAQKASGDMMTDYKFGVERDTSGKLKYTGNLENKVKEDFAKKKSADFNDKGLFKAFDEEKPEFRAILDELSKKTDMNSLGNDGREAYSKILQRTLARDDITLSDEQKTNYENLLERTTAKTFRRGTGEAIFRAEDATTDSEKKAVEDGKKEFDKMTSPEEFNKVKEKARQKKTEKTRDDKFYNREQLSELDKEIDKNVLKPVIENNQAKTDVYKLSEQVRNNGSKQDILDTISNLKNNIDIHAVNHQSDIIDPETGEKYKGEEAFKKSSFSKNINRAMNISQAGIIRQLSEDEEKELKDLTDSLTFDMQRSKPDYLQTGKLKEWTDRKRKKQIENRVVNRDSLTSAVGSIEALQTTDMSSKQRDKTFGNIVKNINKAAKNSANYNKEDEGLNKDLANLQEMSKGVQDGTVKLKDFKDKANTILERYKAK